MLCHRSQAPVASLTTPIHVYGGNFTSSQFPNFSLKVLNFNGAVFELPTYISSEFSEQWSPSAAKNSENLFAHCIQRHNCAEKTNINSESVRNKLHNHNVTDTRLTPDQ
jgi:hypothetical protein